MIKTKDMAMDLNEEEQSRRQDNFKQVVPGTGLTINEKSFITIDKASLTDIAMATVDKYRNGYNSPTDGYLLGKKLVDLGELIKENLGDSAANELKLVKGDKRVQQGATITEQMVGTRYDFKPCGDKLYDELKAKLTERETFLKSIVTPQITGDPETGETWMVSPPVKSGKMGLIVKY